MSICDICNQPCFGGCDKRKRPTRARKKDSTVEGRPSPSTYAVTPSRGMPDKGALLRGFRQAVGLTLSEAARSLAVKAKDLCDVELGRASFIKGDRAYDDAIRNLRATAEEKARLALARAKAEAVPTN